MAVVLLLALCLLVLGGLVIVGRGDVESYLRSHFENARIDAFQNLSGRVEILTLEHAVLFLLAIFAARRMRADVVLVLLVGPAISLALVAIGQDWSDPDWFVIVAVCVIGWFAGIVFTLLYWATHRHMVVVTSSAFK